MWTYQIAAHSLYRDDTFISDGLYSGYPPYVNKSAFIGMHALGPLPPGDYAILSAITHPRLGPVAMPLSPHPENQMLGRGGFYIHGDNPAANQTASEGCIVASHEIRQMISDSTDRQLRVTL